MKFLLSLVWISAASVACHSSTITISTLVSQHDSAIQTANDNAPAAKELEATYKTQIAALEVLAAETAAAEALSRSFADDLVAADDIEIPDSLANSFLNGSNVVDEGCFRKSGNSCRIHDGGIRYDRLSDDGAEGYHSGPNPKD